MKKHIAFALAATFMTVSGGAALAQGMTDATTIPADDNDGDEGKWGLLGLAGFAGLLGLKRRDRDHTDTVRRP